MNKRNAKFGKALSNPRMDARNSRLRVGRRVKVLTPLWGYLWINEVIGDRTAVIINGANGGWDWLIRYNSPECKKPMLFGVWSHQIKVVK